MKVPSTSSIRNTVAALSFAAVVALTGCSGDQSDPSGTSDAGGQPPAASDGGGGTLAGGENGPAAPEADVADVPDVVAVVNGEEIPKEEFVSVYEPQFQQAAMQQQSTGQELDQATLKTQVANRLVDNRLLQQAATDSGIEATDADIDTLLEQIATQNGLGSADEVVSTLEQQGVTEEQIRADAATQFRITAYIEQEGDIQEPTEEELQAQYDQVVQQQSQAGGQATEVPPFEEVKQQLADQATVQQQNEAATTLAAELREQGEVTVNL